MFRFFLNNAESVAPRTLAGIYAGLLALCAPLTSAQMADAGEEDIVELDPFSVTVSDDRGYYSANSTSATRTNELVKNTPISLTVINEQMMEDLTILNDEDLARVTAGVTTDPDGFSFNQIRIRGFRSLTQRYDLFWREIERDGYNIQRVDIVKGANSLIYGQADPGGKVNSIPKKATFGKDFYNLEAIVGNKNFRRYTLDANVEVNDKFALRAMAVDHKSDFDQLYEFRHLRGATLELGIRPFQNSNVRIRYERIELEQNLQPGMFQDATGQNRYARNSLPDETAGDPAVENNWRPSLTLYRNEFVFSPDAVQYLPQELVDDIRIQGNDNPTREEIDALYDPWTDMDALYSSHGPDKRNDRSGDIYTVDWTQRIASDLQFKIAYNREDDDRAALTRDGYSGNRVLGPIGGEYINAHWQRIEGKTIADAIKATLLWELEMDNFLNSRHTVLLGFDWDRLQKSPRTYDQIQAGTTLYDGNYYNTDILKEQLPLANGFGPDAPNVRYNGLDDQFQLKRSATSDVATYGYWMAIQSEFMNGRLRSLLGLRYDDVDVTHSYVDHVISVAPGYFDRDIPDSVTESTINTEFSDNNVPYDQVSPSVGALYWLTEGVGVFANYAESIQSPDGTNLDPFGDVIPPVYGEGYEYGVRFDLWDGKVNGQISAFYIEKENDNIVNYDFRLSDIITYEKYGEEYPNYFFFQNGEYRLQNNALPGKQVAGDVSRAEGVDVEFYYNPTRDLSVVFSYTYNNLDAIKINEAVNPRFGTIPGLAHNNIIVHLRYKHSDGPLKGLSYGMSQSWRSESTLTQYYVHSDDRWYSVTFDQEFNTDAFIRYQTNIGRGAWKSNFSIAYRVRNLWNHDDLMNRNRSAFYRESTQHLFQIGLRF